MSLRINFIFLISLKNEVRLVIMAYDILVLKHSPAGTASVASFQGRMAIYGKFLYP